MPNDRARALKSSVVRRSCVLVAIWVSGYGLDSALRVEALGKPKPKPEVTTYVALGHDDLRCRFMTWISGSCPSRGTSQACTSGEPEQDCNAFVRSGFSFFTGAAHGKPAARFYEPGGELEKYRFLTYAGHSRIGDWAVDKQRYFPLSRASFGGGKTRYLWFVSCSLFAHGPGPAFNRPELFGNLSDADVFSRWTKKSESSRPFGPGLRLACGSSTLIDALPGAISPVLFDLERRGFSIADAFTHGLGAYPGYPRVMPICLTRSEHPDPEQTPLADLVPTDTPNPASEKGFVFIQYPVRTRSAAVGSVLKNIFGEADASRIDRTPPGFGIREMPVLTLHPAPAPDWIVWSAEDDRGYATAVLGKPAKDTVARPISPRAGIALASLRPAPLSPWPAPLHPAGISLKRHSRSGAFLLIYASSSADPTAITRLVDLATRAGAGARGSIDEAGPLLAVSPAEEITLQVDRAAQADIDDGTHRTKITRMVRAQVADRQLVVAYSADPATGERRFVPVEGAGGGETLRYSPAAGGSAALSFLAPRAAAKLGAIRGMEEALTLARAELEKSELGDRRYELSASPTWFYRQPRSEDANERMYLYYRFDFRTIGDPESFSPLTIEIPAHLAAGYRTPTVR